MDAIQLPPPSVLSWQDELAGCAGAGSPVQRNVISVEVDAFRFLDGTASSVP